MQAWPIEEAFVVRPIGSLLLTALLPLGFDAVLTRIVKKERALASARVPVRATSFALAWAIGGTALGPSMTDSAGGVASHAAASLCLALAILVSQWRMGSGDARPLIIGYVLALIVSAGIATVTPHGIFAGSLIVGVAAVLGYRDKRRGDGPDVAGAEGTWIGAALAASVVALLALPIPLTAIRPEDAPQAGDATWRLRIHPWDANAMLASGWAARRRGDLGRAWASAREAIRMGRDEGPAPGLAAEVLAAQGHCERARATFDRAIQVRASDAFEDDSLLAPLVLGGYQLPPTLVTECGGLEQLPGLDDLRL